MVTTGEGVGGWVKQMMRIKEGTCDEHWVLHVSVGSLNCTPEINITLYVNRHLNKNLKKIFLSKIMRGTWMAQCVQHPTLAQVMISQFMSSSPTLGSVLTARSLEPVSDSVSLSLCLSLLTLCLSKINKYLKKLKSNNKK